MNKYENVNDLIKEIYKEINILSQNRPYNGSNIPWLTSKRYIELCSLKEKDIQERRLVEDTYVISPGQGVLLLDELLYESRDKKDLHNTYNRIKELGFTYTFEDNKHTFVVEYKNCLIYADPRLKSSIEFLIYKVNSNLGDNLYSFIGSFKVPDNWKNKLQDKIIDKIKKIIHEIEQ